MKLHPSSRPAPSLAAVLLASAALLAPASAAKPPHIVIVYADDLGQGDLSCYNPKAAYQTPRIDRMAAEGIRFTDAHSSTSIPITATPTAARQHPTRRPQREQ